MGSAIAAHFANVGCEVNLLDVVDNAIDGDYFLEMPASATELQNRYKFKSFEGTVQEGEIQ